MADFRKWLYAFAGVTLLAGLSVPASAQSTLMQCAGSANNPLIRAEEYTALAGDVFITCHGWSSYHRWYLDTEGNHYGIHNQHRDHQQAHPNHRRSELE